MDHVLSPFCTRLGVVLLIVCVSLRQVNCYSEVPVQYHIQTDKGPDRYFRYQTYDGQYRREKRFDDGRVVGTYGWVDPTGLLRLFDYIADSQGYRIVRKREFYVKHSSTQTPPTAPTPPKPPKPVLRPITLAPSGGSRRDKYKSVRQRVKVSNTPIRRISPTPVKVVQHSRRRKPARTRVRTRPTPAVAPVTPLRQAGSSNPTFLTSDVPPHLGYDAPGGRVTIDFDIGNQYRKEKRFPGGVVVGEHGYVDPLGILRKTYYRSDSGGKKEYKRSRWIGTRVPRRS